MPPPRHSLEALPGRLAMAQLPPQAQVPAWAWQGSFVTVSRSERELSILCGEEAVPAFFQASRGWRALRIAGRLELTLTGVMESLLGPLAGAGVSIVAISTFDTDYVLVRESDLEKACAALEAAGHAVKLPA